jgi:hypothetical protein
MAIIGKKQNNGVIWLDPKKVQEALKILNLDCDHPPEKIDLRLGTGEYRCGECQKMYWYKDVRRLVDEAADKKA